MANKAHEVNTEGSRRWWEFYAVRYAMGTVVGAVVVVALARENDALAKLLYLRVDENLSWPTLILLAVLGLTYCYIASGPILVLHAARAWFAYGKNEHGSSGGWYWWATVIFIVVYGVIMYVWLGGNLSGEGWFWFICVVLASGAAVWIAVTAWMAALWALSARSQVFTYYQRLVSTRDSGEAGSLVTSYRHLREHGNSFFIVTLEIIFGMSLFVLLALIGDPRVGTGALIVAVLVWIVPAALVWGIATRVEIGVATSWSD